MLASTQPQMTCSATTANDLLCRSSPVPHFVYPMKKRNVNLTLLNSVPTLPFTYSQFRGIPEILSIAFDQATVVRNELILFKIIWNVFIASSRIKTV